MHGVAQARLQFAIAKAVRNPSPACIQCLLQLVNATWLPFFDFSHFIFESKRWLRVRRTASHQPKSNGQHIRKRAFCCSFIFYFVVRRSPNVCAPNYGHYSLMHKHTKSHSFRAMDQRFVYNKGLVRPKRGQTEGRRRGNRMRKRTHCVQIGFRTGYARPAEWSVNGRE